MPFVNPIFHPMSGNVGWNKSSSRQYFTVPHVFHADKRGIRGIPRIPHGVWPCGDQNEKSCDFLCGSPQNSVRNPSSSVRNPRNSAQNLSNLVPNLNEANGEKSICICTNLNFLICLCKLHAGYVACKEFHGIPQSPCHFMENWDIYGDETIYEISPKCIDQLVVFIW